GGPGAGGVRVLGDAPPGVLLDQVVAFAVQSAVAAAGPAGGPGDGVFPFAGPGGAGAAGHRAFAVPDLDQPPQDRAGLVSLGLVAVVAVLAAVGDLVQPDPPGRAADLQPPGAVAAVWSGPGGGEPGRGHGGPVRRVSGLFRAGAGRRCRLGSSVPGLPEPDRVAVVVGEDDPEAAGRVLGGLAREAPGQAGVEGAEGGGMPGPLRVPGQVGQRDDQVDVGRQPLIARRAAAGRPGRSAAVPAVPRPLPAAVPAVAVLAVLGVTVLGVVVPVVGVLVVGGSAAEQAVPVVLVPHSLVLAGLVLSVFVPRGPGLACLVLDVAVGGLVAGRA